MGEFYFQSYVEDYSEFWFALIHEWFDQSLIVGRNWVFVQSAVPCKVELGFVNISPLVSNRAESSVNLRPFLHKSKQMRSDLSQKLLE